MLFPLTMHPVENERELNEAVICAAKRKANVMLRSIILVQIAKIGKPSVFFSLNRRNVVPVLGQ